MVILGGGLVVMLIDGLMVTLSDSLRVIINFLDMIGLRYLNILVNLHIYLGFLDRLSRLVVSVHLALLINNIGYAFIILLFNSLWSFALLCHIFIEELVNIRRF